MNLVKSAFAVMPARPLQHDSARGYATPAMLEFGHMFLDGILDFRGAGHALEFDSGGVCISCSHLSAHGEF